MSSDESEKKKKKVKSGSSSSHLMHHHSNGKKKKKCNQSRVKPTSLKPIKKKASRVAPRTLMIFWEILKKEKRQNLMRIGEDVIWNRLHLLLLRQGLCLGCQNAVYGDIKVLKEDLQERVGPCFIEVKKQSVCLREDMLGNMDILCLLQRASEVQSEEEEEPREGCPSVDSPALSYEYLVDVVAVVFKEHLESAYGLAQQKSRAFESLLLEEETLENERRTKKKKKKKKKKRKKSKGKKENSSPTSSGLSSPKDVSDDFTVKSNDTSATLSSNHNDDENNDAEDRKSCTSSVATPTKKSSSHVTLENNGKEWENVDREVEEFRRMLEQNTTFSPETRPKIKIEFPKDAFSKMKTTAK
eukprot:g1714.t1